MDGNATSRADRQGTPAAAARHVRHRTGHLGRHCASAERSGSRCTTRGGGAWGRQQEEQRAQHAAIPGGTAQRRGTQYTAAELKLREDFARCVLQHLALFHLPLECLLLLAP